MADQRQRAYILSLVFLAALSVPTFFIERHLGAPLLFSYFIAFACYLKLWTFDFRFLLILGVVARLLLFSVLPTLSDDIYRFLWDGFLLNHGLNPYTELPFELIGEEIPGNTSSLYSRLNSPSYYTVYPPLNQAIFWIAVKVSQDWIVATGVIRSFLVAADVGTAYYLNRILKKYGKNQNLALLYFLNPLVILEGVGNVHFEVLVVFFLVTFVYHFGRSPLKAGICFALAAGTKLLPLIFGPYILFNSLNKRGWLIIPVIGVSLAILFSPLFIFQGVHGVLTSLTLYARNFEFNPSFYLAAKEIGISITGYNQIEVIGPVFSAVSLCMILVLTFISIRKKWPIEKIMLFLLSIYLVLTTTVHPWYILPLIPLGLLSGYIFPLIWSLTIFITYFGYTSSGYELHWSVIALEYLLVFLAFIYNQQLKTWLTIS